MTGPAAASFRARRPSLVKHQLADFLRLVGMRDRLRCPRCRAVGTWKPHGGWLDGSDEGPRRRRWMCKWCGLYRGPELGVTQARPGERAWAFAHDYPESPTPQERCEPLNPWAG